MLPVVSLIPEKGLLYFGVGYMRYIQSFLSSFIVNDLMLRIAIDSFRDSPNNLSKPKGKSITA